MVEVGTGGQVRGIVGVVGTEELTGTVGLVVGTGELVVGIGMVLEVPDSLLPMDWCSQGSWGRI